MSSMLLVTMITTKLTGTASLMWHHHKKNNDQGSSSRIKSWKGLKELLFRTKITEEHEGSILSQIDLIQQKGSIKEYNTAFDKLTMQIADLLVHFEKHYYLKGLKKEVRQLAESNKDNLIDMMTLKAACIRQDNIISSNPYNKKKNDDTNETALNASLTKNDKGK